MIVQKKGSNLKNTGTPNSTSIIISCEGWINIPLSAKKLDPKPMYISLAT